MNDLLELLQEWHNYCNKMAKIHDRMRAIMRWRNYAIYIPAIILSTIAGTATVSLGTQSCKENDEWVIILFGSMGLLSTAMFSVHRYLLLPELQKEYDFYSDEFEKLRLDIQMNVLLNNSGESTTYRNLSEYTKECKKKMDIIIDKGPAYFQRVATAIEKELKKKPNQIIFNQV